MIGGGRFTRRLARGSQPRGRKQGVPFWNAVDETGYQRLRLARDDAWTDLELARLALEEHQREPV
jgi:hypothetical protein